MRTSSLPRLHVTEVGEGPPLLVITGWTISSAIFDEPGERLAPHARVIAYDHRGTGRSAPWPAPVSMAMLAADAARVLEDRGLSSAHVMGLSLGAAVAVELAVRKPEHVRTLTLVGGSPGGPGVTLPPTVALARTRGELGLESVRRRRLWPTPVLFSEEFRRREPARAAELTEPFVRHRPPPWASGWQTLATTCFHGSTALPRVQAPTLLLHGSEDVMVPLANARRMAALIPDAELHEFPGAGHAAPFECPDEATAVMVRWLERHASRSRQRRRGAGRSPSA